MLPLTTIAAGLLLCGVGNAAPSVDLEFEERSLASRFKYYDMPTKEAGPCDITTGPDGNIWVQDFLVNKLARIDPNTGAIKEYTIPYKNKILNITLPGQAPGRTGLTACVVQPGEDGYLYAASGVRNEFLKVNTKTGQIKIFDTGNLLGNLQPLNDVYRGPTGMFFTQTTQNLITLFDYKTETMKSWQMPTPASNPVGVYVTKDGAAWVCEFVGNKIARLNATTGVIKEYAAPLGCQPAVMRAETRSKGQTYLWYTCFIGQGMGSINTATGETKFYPAMPLLSFPVEDTVDSRGRVWFSTATANSLSALTPSTGKVRVVSQPDSIVAPLPLPGGLPPAANIAVHYGPKNSIWFSELARNRVGKFQLVGCGNTITPCTA